MGLRDLFRSKSQRESDRAEAIAAEYRARMHEELDDVRAKSARAGRLADMKRLRDQILNSCTAKVVEELAEKHGISRGDIFGILVDHPKRD